MMILQTSGISKSYGVASILNNISIQVDERERMGLVGVNGAGKSTLLQILAGELSCDSGTMAIAKEIRIGYLAQNSGLTSDHTIGFEMLSVFSHLTQAEQELRKLERDMADADILKDSKRYQATLDRYASRSEWFRDHGGFEMEAKIRGILHGMGFGQFPQDTPVRSLSGGQKTRLALAKMLLQEPDLLLLDEPTNHLDIQTLTWLEDYLRVYPGAIIVVSHDRFFLDAIVNTIVEIERHSAVRYNGNYSKFVQMKEAELTRQLKQYEQQQGEIARMEDFIRRNIARATTTRRAQSRRKALERMEKLNKPLGELKRASFGFEIERHTGKDVLNADQISYAYEEGRPLFPPISMRLQRGDSMALIGPNGIGKTTLLRMLVGDLPIRHGAVQWGSNVKIGYYDQEQTGLNAANSILEDVWSAFPHLEEARIRTVLGNFLFSGEDVLKKISALSGGEKARVSLAKLMLQKANVLILDEPTNHLDLYSREVLESALLEYEGTLLFISHDRYFLNKIADRMMELTPLGADYFLGNYDDYLDKKNDLVESEAEKSTDTPEKTAVAGYESDKLAKREERSRQRRLEQLEQRITKLEQQASRLEARMADPSNAHDYMLLGELQQELASTGEELESCYAEWGQLAES